MAAPTTDDFCGWNSPVTKLNTLFDSYNNLTYNNITISLFLCSQGHSVLRHNFSLLTSPFLRGEKKVHCVSGLFPLISQSAPASAHSLQVWPIPQHPLSRIIRAIGCPGATPTFPRTDYSSTSIKDAQANRNRLAPATNLPPNDVAEKGAAE